MIKGHNRHRICSYVRTFRKVLHYDLLKKT